MLIVITIMTDTLRIEDVQWDGLEALREGVGLRSRPRGALFLLSASRVTVRATSVRAYDDRA